MATRDFYEEAAQQAVDSIGLGFDLTQDIGFKNCKWDSGLILVNEELCRDLLIPGGVRIPNVPISIRCVRGEVLRLQSEVLSFDEMSEQFNLEMHMSTGRIPSGHFCASFSFSGNWAKDAASTKSLAFDGYFAKCYTIEYENSYRPILQDHVKQAVPSSWDTEALATFIKKFGTHVVVVVSMGGKDVVYVKQEHSSCLKPSDVQFFLKNMADRRFMDSAQDHHLGSGKLCEKQNIVALYDRRGGSMDKNLNHKKWLDSLVLEPGVVSMILTPLASLVNGVSGSGMLTYAIDLYLRYKPSTEDLLQFLDFQLLRRQWAPIFDEIRLGHPGKHQANTWLRLGLVWGPKLYINTILVDVGKRPVTGLRLKLEGTKSNRLSIQLQHLDSLPKCFLISDHADAYKSCISDNGNFHKRVKWGSFLHVCTAPVESDDPLSIVTAAQLQVTKNCLHLGLRFSKVIDATLQKTPEWDGPNDLVQFVRKEQKREPKPGAVIIGSTAYSCTRPVPIYKPKLQRFVETSEMIRGPANTPGCWVVSGARLSLQDRKITLLVKYSLFRYAM